MECNAPFLSKGMRPTRARTRGGYSPSMQRGPRATGEARVPPGSVSAGADPATLDRFVSRYPRLYHVAEHGSWPDIRRHGLLSTSALLDLFEIAGAERSRVETEWRPEPIRIEHRDRGTAVIRDQRPMPPERLGPLLKGVTVKQWYELLNGKVFFWVTQARLEGFLNAKPYRNRMHDVIVVDTAELLRRYWDRITISSINTGSTYNRSPRGLETLRPIAAHRRADVVELAVERHVPDIAEFTLSVKRRGVRGPAPAAPL